MIVRGNQMIRTSSPTGDKTWTKEDKARAQTVEARWISTGIPTQEIKDLLPCLIWKKKLPGLRYTSTIESRLDSLSVKS
jgi:hypothetical protein